MNNNKLNGGGGHFQLVLFVDATDGEGNMSNIAIASSLATVQITGLHLVR